MTVSNGALHVYRRELDPAQRSSLTVLSALITPGATVLDVGTGSGALGCHLRDTLGCTVDGVTYNSAEAALAAPFYRRVQVADLDTSDLAGLWAGQRYDFIVCADVLEHLRAPQGVLQSCTSLLGEDGRVLISVPNAAYCGLLGELLGGDFRYREEGLLDATHLRFFTRRSLLRFLDDSGWHAQAIEQVCVDIADSEFQPVFDRLPPAVARYLLTLPDAFTYQFVVSARPGPGNAEGLDTPGVTETLAHYSLQLYGRQPGSGYSESCKTSATARIGADLQWVEFDLAALTPHPQALRLDPSDRPGLLRLHGMELLDRAGARHWQWDQQRLSLAGSHTHQIVLQTPWEGLSGILALLTGDDPHIELPIPTEALAKCAGGRLRIALGWPMSADATLFAEQFARQAVHHAALADGLAQARLDLQSACAETARDKEALHQLTEELAQASAALHAQQLEQGRLEARCQNQQADIDQLRSHLDEIHNSTVFRVTRPLVRLKMKLDRTIRPADDAPRSYLPPVQRIAPNPQPVDIIVPVYRGLTDTRCCIEAVLRAASHAGASCPFRLIVINDASPEAELTAWLRSLPARDERIMLLENPSNLGFVGTVNRGMAISPERDVVLLNSDAEVAGNWLERLQACAYSNPRAGTVTPVSNNATICSYPRFCADNALPQGYDTAALDTLFATTNSGTAVEIPTAIGFCMYIRRDCLTQTGYFDEARFGKGYGEENDFCMRARKLGWRHLFALDTFVRHAGGVSFGEHKSPREREAQAILQTLHPHYETVVHAHIGQDPARPWRQAVDLARIAASGLPSVLMVTHNRGGGTARHIHELAALLRPHALSFTLSPAPGGETLLEWANEGEAFRLGFRLPSELPALLQALQAIRVSHIHVHHLLGHHPVVADLARRLSIAYDFTAHDYYALCPQISLTDISNRYCGERGIEQCKACLTRLPAPGGVGIEIWRANHRKLLAEARNVFAPSADAARRIRTLAPEAKVSVVPHIDLKGLALPTPAPQAIGERRLKIVVIGALSPIKGADLLEEAALLAAQQRLPLEFHLIGYAYRSLRVQPRASLTVHGAYEESELPALLDWLQPDLAWFPALWPETYSYTLSACLTAGLPILAPDIGAFRERLQGRQWTWIHPWDTDARTLTAQLSQIRSEHFSVALPPPPLQAGGAGEVSGFDYLRDYLPTPTTPAPTPVTLDTDFLYRQRSGRQSGLHGARSALKARALGIVLRLRSSALLRGLARRIPLHWQTRVKSWLLA